MSENFKALEIPFLDALIKDQVPVSIYLVNGIKLQGKVAAYDETVVLLKNTFSQIIYKHAISTVVPMRKVTVEGVVDDEPHAEEHV